MSAVRNRIAWIGAWNRTHNNPRYAELMPRLDNVDRYYIDLHPWWPIRGFRRRVELPLRSIWCGRTYPLMFTQDWRQIRLFHAPCVVDHDDPVYGAAELAALARPNVRLIVVTTAAVKDRLLAAGIQKPMEVIPQGVALPVVNPARVQAIRGEWTGGGDHIVTGIHQPHFEFSRELAGDPLAQMYAVDDMFSVMEAAHGRNADLRLALVGKPSEAVRQYAESRPWIILAGYHPRSELMEYVSAFDIGLYPRRVDVGGRSSVKVMEYMACGVPVAGFRTGEMDVVEEADAGILAADIPALSAALSEYGREGAKWRAWGERGRRWATARDWAALAARYRALLTSVEASK